MSLVEDVIAGSSSKRSQRKRQEVLPSPSYQCELRATLPDRSSGSAPPPVHRQRHRASRIGGSRGAPLTAARRGHRIDNVFIERLWRSLNHENIATAVDTPLRLDGVSALCLLA